MYTILKSTLGNYIWLLDRCHIFNDCCIGKLDKLFELTLYKCVLHYVNLCNVSNTITYTHTLHQYSCNIDMYLDFPDFFRHLGQLHKTAMADPEM